MMNLRHNIENYQSAQTSGGSRLSGRRVWTVFQLLPRCVSDLERFQTFGYFLSQCTHIFRERTEEMFLLIFNGVSLGERGTFVSHVCILAETNREMTLVTTVGVTQELRLNNIRTQLCALDS